MPSEQSTLDLLPAEPSQIQVKLCSRCHSVVVDPPQFRQEDEPLVCVRCQTLPAYHSPQPFRPNRRHWASTISFNSSSTFRPDTLRCSPESVQESPEFSQITPLRPPTSADDSLDFDQDLTNYLPAPCLAPTRPSTDHMKPLLPDTAQRHMQPIGYFDPLVDITRLRVRSQSHHCLYPGATFQGTQKSGRSSYDVSVTIVDVNLPYFLCGYLRIRGLTDDWPELTTYFDAEIIGSRHGFLTQKWGADEDADLSHWNRFPAFKHVKSEALHPNMTISDRDRGVVFMRWKEKFLVPDHRVQDVNGASFAGFYYVCIDFNPPYSATTASRTDSRAQSRDPTHLSATPEMSVSLNSVKTKRGRRSSNSLLTPRMNLPNATMNGFYYHQNSEPYQQLALHHVPEIVHSCFEFR